MIQPSEMIEMFLNTREGYASNELLIAVRKIVIFYNTILEYDVSQIARFAHISYVPISRILEREEDKDGSILLGYQSRMKRRTRWKILLYLYERFSLYAVAMQECTMEPYVKRHTMLYNAYEKKIIKDYLKYDLRVKKEEKGNDKG